MNKAKLIEKVSERIKIPSNAAKIIVNTIFDSMRESLKKGGGIEICYPRVRMNPPWRYRWTHPEVACL